MLLRPIPRALGLNEASYDLILNMGMSSEMSLCSRIYQRMPFRVHVLPCSIGRNKDSDQAILITCMQLCATRMSALYSAIRECVSFMNILCHMNFNSLLQTILSSKKISNRSTKKISNRSFACPGTN